MQTPSNRRQYPCESSLPVRGSLIDLLRGNGSNQHPLNTVQSSQEPRTHSTGPTQSHVKRSKYLRETDRRSIIRRIDSGEKQAALAKEFGVTRAAICHTYKKRVEILARSVRRDRHPPVDHARRDLHKPPLDPATAFTTPRVTAVRSAPLAMHMTTLRCTETKHRKFRATADRIFFLLLEEALASVPLRAVDVITTHNGLCPGLVVDRPTCAMVMSERGYPLLETFRVIQPDSPTGFVTFSAGGPLGLHRPRRPVLSKLSFPLDLSRRDTFLLDAVCIGYIEAVAAIQSLVDLGAPETSVHLVTLVISTAAAEEIRRRFPRVSITTAAVDTEVAETDSESSSIGDFLERYFNTTTIHQDEFSCPVDL